MQMRSVPLLLYAEFHKRTIGSCNSLYLYM